MIEIELNFRDPTCLDRCGREGWGEAEGFGAWMVGDVSRLVLPPPPRSDGAFELRAVFAPMLYDGRRDGQLLRIFVNGLKVFEQTISYYQQISCPVPTEVVTARSNIEIVIEHPGAASPADMGTGDDVRKIAAGAVTLTLLGTSPLPDERAPVFTRPVFQTRSFGNLANRMIQHMVALAVQARAPSCVLAGPDVPEWGIRTLSDNGTWADLALVDEQRIDVEGVAALLESRSLHKVVHRGFGQRMAQFLPRERYRDVFVTHEPGIVSFDSRYLVMNVRSAEVVSGQFRDYVLTPLNFYRDLIEQTGLIPVFTGQLEPNAYTDALRAQFPAAIYHESQGPVRDFETVRRSKNIVISVSTFSWLAAWLSDADQIFMPVNGLLNPLQFPAVDLLPLDDARYRFFLFPINNGNPNFAAAHRAIDGQWREVSAQALREALAQAPVEIATPEPEARVDVAPAVQGLPMFDDVRPIVAAAEEAASRGYVLDVLHHLRLLSLPDFAELMWSLPRADLPGISGLLPAMAPEAAQLGWNGKSGAELRMQSVDVCRIMAAGFQRFTGRPMQNIRVLDFGCGWGRLLRMMAWYTDPQNCCGVDAMHQAIERCREDGVQGRLVRAEYIPADLDVGERRFDLIVAYSVFTHTPLRAMQVALANLRRKIRGNGLLAITIRPVEIWATVGGISPERRLALEQAHRQDGFAFLPIGVTDQHGEDVYGETSVAVSYLAANFPEWEVEGTDRGIDPMQLIVFLSPR